MRISHVALLASLVASRGGGRCQAPPRRRARLRRPAPLADTGRSHRDVAARRAVQHRRDAALGVRARAGSRATARSSGARPAKQAGVDAVIEGWVQDEGRHHVMTVAVRDASTGNEIDTIACKLGDTRRLDRRGHQLAAQLDDIFGYIDDDITSASDGAQLPDIRTMRPMLGAHHEEPRAGRRRGRATPRADEA